VALTHFKGAATAAEFRREEAAREELIPPFDDITRTPAWAFLTVLGLESSAVLAPEDETALRDARGWSTRRIAVPALHQTKDFRGGLGLLARELGEAPHFDLVYTPAGLLIGIVPVIPHNLHAARGASQAPFRYFDLTPYYLEVPSFGNPHAWQRWETMAVTAQLNEALLDRYLQAQAYTHTLLRAGGSTPYVMGTADPQTGHLDLDRVEINGANPFSRERGPGKTVLFPVFPTVFPPTLASDNAYHRSIFGKGPDQDHPVQGVRPGDRVWLVGPGSGFDTWLVSLMTRETIHVSGLNPFEIANVKLFAAIAGFNVEAVVHDNIADLHGHAAFSNLIVDWIFWNMPHLEETVPASPYRRFSDHHDGDPGGMTLQRFFWYLPDLLGNGMARIWNAGEAYVSIIVRMAYAAGVDAWPDHITDENAVYTLTRKAGAAGQRLGKRFTEFWPTADTEKPPFFRGRTAA